MTKLLTMFRDIILNFVFVFVVLIVATYLYNQIAYSTTRIDWNSTIKYTVVLGTIFTAVKLYGSKQKES